MRLILHDDSDGQDEDNYSDVSSEENSGYLVIDTSVLNDSTDVSTSLTDINGVALFTDSYESIVCEIANHEQQERENYHNVVFNNSLYEPIEQWRITKDKLFINEEQAVVRNKTNNYDNTKQIMLIATTITVVTAFILVCLVFIRSYNKRRKNATDIYTYQ